MQDKNANKETHGGAVKRLMRSQEKTANIAENASPAGVLSACYAPVCDEPSNERPNNRRMDAKRMELMKRKKANIYENKVKRKELGLPLDRKGEEEAGGSDESKEETDASPAGVLSACYAPPSPDTSHDGYHKCCLCGDFTSAICDMCRISGASMPKSLCYECSRIMSHCGGHYDDNDDDIEDKISYLERLLDKTPTLFGRHEQCFYCGYDPFKCGVSTIKKLLVMNQQQRWLKELRESRQEVIELKAQLQALEESIESESVNSSVSSVCY